jgi:hypothetical protein
MELFEIRFRPLVCKCVYSHGDNMNFKKFSFGVIHRYSTLRDAGPTYPGTSRSTSTAVLNVLVLIFILVLVTHYSCSMYNLQLRAPPLVRVSRRHLLKKTVSTAVPTAVAMYHLVGTKLSTGSKPRRRQ